MKPSAAPTIVVLLVASLISFAQDMPNQAAVDEARKHIDGRYGFYSHMNELRLGDDCGGYSEVYRLFILRTFSDSQIIRIGSRNGHSRLTHSIGRLGSVQTTIVDIDDAVFDRFKTKVQSTPFLSMDVRTGVWGIDTDKYLFEWCSAGRYYAVEREYADPELGEVFDVLKELAESEVGKAFDVFEELSESK